MPCAMPALQKYKPLILQASSLKILRHLTLKKTVRANPSVVLTWSSQEKETDSGLVNSTSPEGLLLVGLLPIDSHSPHYCYSYCCCLCGCENGGEATH